MARFLKLIGALFASLLAILATISVGMSVWLRVSGQAWIEKFVKTELHSDIAIGSVHPNFLNEVLFSDVVIKNPTPLHLQSVKISVRPWEFFNPTNPLGSILFADFEGLEGEVQPPN